MISLSGEPLKANYMMDPLGGRNGGLTDVMYQLVIGPMLSSCTLIHVSCATSLVSQPPMPSELFAELDARSALA